MLLRSPKSHDEPARDQRLTGRDCSDNLKVQFEVKFTDERR